jgi:hypothetical protein
MPKTPKVSRVTKKSTRTTKNVRSKKTTTVSEPKISLSKLSTFLTIYRKFVSNLKIREEILRKTPSVYEIGPTIIWTENSSDLPIFTSDENYTHFVGFDEPFSNPRSKQYLGKTLKSLRMVKGSILIKEATPTNAMHIPVHFCAYRINDTGVMTIFDPSWHGSDPGIYSTTAFYDSLDAFNIPYVHAFPNRTHHWQSLLPDDVFCQTWTLKWLYDDNAELPLPKSRLDASKHVAEYIRFFIRILQKDLSIYVPMFPAYKLEGNTAETVFRTLVTHNTLDKTVHRLF